MSAKINVTKDIQRLYDAEHHVQMDLGLYASRALLTVVPDGITVPEMTMCQTSFSHDKTLTVQYEYHLENIPAHGTWKFTFMFRSSRAGIVIITKCNSSVFDTRSCNFDIAEIGEKVKELAEL